MNNPWSRVWVGLDQKNRALEATTVTLCYFTALCLPMCKTREIFDLHFLAKPGFFQASYCDVTKVEVPNECKCRTKSLPDKIPPAHFCIGGHMIPPMFFCNVDIIPPTLFYKVDKIPSVNFPTRTKPLPA